MRDFSLHAPTGTSTCVGCRKKIEFFAALTRSQSHAVCTSCVEKTNTIRALPFPAHELRVLFPDVARILELTN
jgi:hypothetical protein